MARKKNSEAIEEPSEIKAELLALTGSIAEYDAMLDSIGEQLRAIAESGHRIEMKGDRVVSVSIPEKRTQPRKPVAKTAKSLATNY